MAGSRSPERRRARPALGLSLAAALAHAAALALASAGAVSAAAAEMPAPAHGWLVEALCGAGEGHAEVPAILAPDCKATRLRGPDDEPAYERHDMPAAHEAGKRQLGYQRSTSWLARRPDGRLEAVQTFDFGGGERSFGAFDGGRGDGGQVVRLEGDTAVIAMTEDGSGGVQWFTGSRCRTGSPPERSGWVLFSGAASPQWRSVVAELRITPTEADCPTAFDRSLTRWRVTELDWPAAFNGVRLPERPVLSGLPTLISEHYGRAEIARADHLERFYLVRGVGLARWERWEHAGRSRRPDVEARSERLARSQRCPELASPDGPASEPPDAEWRRVDCRHWMNFVAAAPGRAGSAPTARAFGWARANPPGSGQPEAPRQRSAP